MNLSAQRKGLTMVELIITIAIVAVIASAIYASIDPVRRLNQSRNSRRMIDLSVVLDGLKAYQADHDNLLRYCTDDENCDPADDEDEGWARFADNDNDTFQLIGENRGGLTCVAGDEPTVEENEVQCLTVPETTQATILEGDCFVAFSNEGIVLETLQPYLRTMPADPSQSGDAAIDDTRYYVNFDPETGAVTVGACNGEATGKSGSGEPDTISITR